MAGQALKNTDRSDYLFTRSTQSALTLAKHLRDVQAEVQPESVPLTSVDQCATAHQGKWLAVDRSLLILLNLLSLVARCRPEVLKHRFNQCNDSSPVLLRLLGSVQVLK